ncbi:MAG: type I restriction endonuclease subunit R, partial [Verrucomicrobiae bacterium]|nr:type I restriction endonuclease subunit R [Verrucomicrobiae bacterium]
LDGIQAVQTLSRLNRSHPGKDTTYVLDFVNDPADILEAFKVYHTTAELSTTTDPNLVFNLRAKLDAAGHYDDAEVDRVVAADLNPNSKQSELVAAVTPVADRLLKRYKVAMQSRKEAEANADDAGAKAAKEELDALVLFKGDLGAFVRLYTFLSQIFDYGNTDIEKRWIFFKRLLPLLDFEREGDTVDLTKIVLTRHHLRNRGKQPLYLNSGDAKPLPPITDPGGGSVRVKEKILLAQVIEKLNELFGADTSDDDQLLYVNGVLMGKMLESEKLRQQAASNTREQFATSPDLGNELNNAIIEALDAHTSMSTKALNSPEVKNGILKILLEHSKLWEKLRAAG